MYIIILTVRFSPLIVPILQNTLDIATGTLFFVQKSIQKYKKHTAIIYVLYGVTSSINNRTIDGK